MSQPQPGDPAPTFSMQTDDGTTVSNETLAGRRYVLYFYPKDDTPGCTKQACGLRDRMTDLKKDNVEVVGVSFDNEESHRKFREKHNLNFTLLADTDGKITDAYSVRRGQ